MSRIGVRSPPVGTDIPRAPAVAAFSDADITVQDVFAAFQARPNRAVRSEWGPTHGAAGLPITGECTSRIEPL